ncbi:MAG: Peptidase M3A and M3B thimet/oligopeptidase F [Parcubacteria group bacterium GW2011_GWD1_40_9]|nr:MAG: Peptidase M3A and M3B thimet/oligopeptidase F [Parcubacteria group bacterium GW2011_GWD1_40_9]
MSKKTTNKINTEWNLKQLYKSPDDSQIENDLLFAEKAYEVFAKKYKTNSKYMTEEASLLNALRDYEKISDIPVSKTYMYLHLAQDLDSKNVKVRAKMNLVSQRLQKIGNSVLFFEVNLSKILPKYQKLFLCNKKLSKYNYLLRKTFETGKYVLTEPEEKILSLKSLPSRKLWTDAFRKIISKQTVRHNGKDIPISEASVIIRDLKTQAERKKLHDAVMDKYCELSEMAESELNAIVTDKKINDELRGYDKAYDSTILGYENDRKSVLNLVKTVTDNFNVAHRFYAIKARMLKLKNLNYSDRAVPVGKTKRKVTFSESSDILQKLFSSIDPKFGEILKGYLANRQIDAFPKVGKKGGAYCSYDHKTPTFVLLNHTNTFESLSTFAHEMGHAIHSEFSRTQPAIYESHSTSTAEVASTLFESFLFYDQFEKFSKEEKIVALHDKIQDDVATIFRQIACFNFELEMHETIREKGNMTKEELALCMNKHMKNYLGSKFKLDDKDGYSFVGWPHIRYFFYVYSYAFGQLASKALYKKYQEDKTYIEKIKKFLSLGGSMSPEDIFKSIGVDVLKPDFFKKGIESIEEDVKMLERLVARK